MITKDEDGSNVLVFGSGDIEIGSGHLDDPDENWGFVTFSKGKKGEIGRETEVMGEYGCNPEAMGFKHHTRLCFTDTKSIDVVIEHLEKAKKAMLDDGLVGSTK